MRQVGDALDRIHAGTFGICGDFKENIHPKLLAAIPDREQMVSWSETDAPMVTAA
jgi:RNA polymerase-binding transcription factor DksA